MLPFKDLSGEKLDKLVNVRFGIHWTRFLARKLISDLISLRVVFNGQYTPGQHLEQVL